MSLGHRHPDGGGEALPEGAGRDLDAVGVAVLGMSGSRAAELTEVAEVVDREAEAAEVEEGVLQHRGMTGGEHEPVTVGPRRLGRVVGHDPPEQHVGEGRQGERGAGVAAVGRSDGIHLEPTGDADAALLQLAGRRVRR